MTHGIAGTSANAAASRRGAKSRGRNSAALTRRRTNNPSATNGAAQNVDRDALLLTLFPNGIPPRQEVIVQVSAWLDEADRLARTR